MNSDIIDKLIEIHRHRQDLHRAEKSLTNQIKSICRRIVGGKKKNPDADVLYKALMGKGDHKDSALATKATLPLMLARDIIKPQRLAAEKEMEKLAARLPVQDFVNKCGGFALLSLGSLIGEAHDLSGYANPAKLWKRMGLAVIRGQRQRCVTEKDLAIEMGYSPNRRAIMYVIGENIIRAQIRSVKNDAGEKIGDSKAIGEYGQLYLDRKQQEQINHPDLSKIVWHRRAKRYMEKRLLRNLWREWCRADLVESLMPEIPNKTVMESMAIVQMPSNNLVPATPMQPAMFTLFNLFNSNHSNKFVADDH